MKRITIGCLAALVCVAACGGDDPTAPADVDDNLPGSLSFDFLGAGGGRYDATGVVPATHSEAAFLATTWVAASRGGTGATTGLIIVANLARGAGVSDEVILTIPRQSAATVNISSANCPPGDHTCAGMMLITGANGSSSGFTSFCYLTTGTVSITSISTTRVQGAFAGSGTCLVPPPLASTPFSVSNAKFDVPFASVGPASASR